MKAYTVTPTETDSMTWGEVKYVPHPRWHLAGRVNYSRSYDGVYRHRRKAYEFVVGYRQSRNRLIKVGYQAVTGLGQGVRSTTSWPFNSYLRSPDSQKRSSRRWTP